MFAEIVYNDFVELLLKSEAEETNGGKVEKNFDEKGHIIKKLTQEEIVGQARIQFCRVLPVSEEKVLMIYPLFLRPSVLHLLCCRNGDHQYGLGPATVRACDQPGYSAEAVSGPDCLPPERVRGHLRRSQQIEISGQCRQRDSAKTHNRRKNIQAGC